jgi:hypothetical protein
MQRWWREIAPQIGWSSDQVRIATGSVGVVESCIEVEIQLRNFTELDAAWLRLAAMPEQAEWARDLALLVVSGSARWTVLRLVAN